MNNEEGVKITLELNGLEAALVTASLMSSRAMLEQSVSQAIDDGLMPIAQLAKKEIVKLDKMLDGIHNKGHYESDTFIIDREALAQEMRLGIEAMQMAKKQMKQMEQSKEPPPEKGKDWDDAGDNVVSILDKFKKDNKDE